MSPGDWSVAGLATPTVAATSVAESRAEAASVGEWRCHSNLRRCCCCCSAAATIEDITLLK